jgi:hypothetical protein
VARTAAVGFLLGASYITVQTLFHPGSLMSRVPIAMAIFAALMGLVVFGGAAISHYCFADSMPKLPDEILLKSDCTDESSHFGSPRKHEHFRRHPGKSNATRGRSLIKRSQDQ